MFMPSNREQRVVANDECNDGQVDYTIDTCRVNDSVHPFETGICHPLYGDRIGQWIIVEQYDSKEEAIEGHKKWLEIMKIKPKCLTDFGQCEIKDLAVALGENLSKTYQRKELQ